MGRFSTVDPLPSFVSGRIGIFRDGQKEKEGREQEGEMGDAMGGRGRAMSGRAVAKSVIFASLNSLSLSFLPQQLSTPLPIPYPARSALQPIYILHFFCLPNCVSQSCTVHL